MNILYFTMSRIETISSRGIYPDLLRYMRDQGHDIWLVSPRERSLRMPTGMNVADGIHFLGVRTLNLQKTNMIEKGLGQLLVEYQYRKAIRSCLNNIHFDLILYSTPPITFSAAIQYAKKRNPQAKTYLLLKDIFPQNAIDIGMMSKSGVKGLLYKYFRCKEKKLYSLSDHIGCMSPANVEYVLKHNPEVAREKVEIAPNSVDLRLSTISDISENDKRAIREKYGLPTNKPVFIFGGNLGKPQGIPFFIKCLNANGNREDSHFMVIGNGTESLKIKKWYEETKPKAVTLMERIPKADYDRLVASCDVGLIFLDHRFTIPNFPSRLLPYLENKMPVIAATDPNSDIGKIAEENGYGFWCESNSVEAFTAVLDKMIAADRKAMGKKGYEFLCKNFSVQNTYEAIFRHV